MQIHEVTVYIRKDAGELSIRKVIFPMEKDEKETMPLNQCRSERNNQ